MGQGDSARDFDTSESMKNAGILDVFPIFHTARLGQKIRRSPQYPLCGVAIEKMRENRRKMFQNSVIAKSRPMSLVWQSPSLEVMQPRIRWRFPGQ